MVSLVRTPSALLIHRLEPTGRACGSMVTVLDFTQYVTSPSLEGRKVGDWKFPSYETN